MDTIMVSALSAGDVLLYKGTSFVSRAIQLLDGTEYSHAALYLGNSMVGEAVSTGLERRTLQLGAVGIWVQAHRLKEAVPTMDPVLSVANAYLDQGPRYAYEQLLLLAFLCLTRKLRLTPSLSQMVRAILDAAAAGLTRLFSEHRQPMICSEFVYRAYDEAVAGPDDAYSLWISRPAPPPGVGARAAFAEAAEIRDLTQSRGQGIHPQSLLAALSARSDSDWVRTDTVKASFAARARREPESTELESLVEAYLAEVQAGPEATRGLSSPELTLAELSDPSAGFAASFYAATHPEEGAQGRELSAPATAAFVAAHLRQTAADFVTPGDLYKTESLFTLGRIEV